MQMSLPKHIPTLSAMSTGNFTRPNNVFTSSSISNLIISCSSLPEQHPTCTDHFPIVMILDLSIPLQDESPKHNFRLTDWPKFRDKLEPKLNSTIQTGAVADKTIFCSKLNALTNCILKTIDEVVPLL
ncbi:hypothetical protein K439DRAFT_1333892 [Ramaria rubella]|nr:hypothetical protein K439DRAFT_1333892 [Ramaria rubella]